NRGEEVLRRYRVVLDVGGAGVAGAVDLSAADAAAGEQGGLTRAPVVAAAVLVDRRRAAELAHRGDQRLVGQAAVVQVFQQRRVPLVKTLAADGAAQQVEARLRAVDAVAGVVVPDVGHAAVGEDIHPGDVDEADAGLDESAGEQEALAVLVAA